MDNISIGKLICSQRKRIGLTQQQLAERLGITNKAISKWETGDGLPDISLIVDLANELQITADELLEGKIVCEDGKSTSKFKPEIKNLVTVIISIVLSGYLFLNNLSNIFNQLFANIVFVRANKYLGGRGFELHSLSSFVISGLNIFFWGSAMMLCVILLLSLLRHQSHKSPLSAIIMIISGICIGISFTITLGFLSGLFYIILSLTILLLTFHGAKKLYWFFYWLSIITISIAIIVGLITGIRGSVGLQIYVVSLSISNITIMAYWIMYGLSIKDANRYSLTHI